MHSIETTQSHTESWRHLQPVYKTKDGSLSDRFFKPCIKECIRYRRAAGFFSSTALISWASAFENSHIDAINIDLLISPEISELDRVSFERATSDEERVLILVSAGDFLIGALLSEPANPTHLSNFLVWLIASGKLQVKFALPRHIENSGMFHQKTGVFEFPGGASVAFDGSANESDSGYRRNYESLQVFRSWSAGDHERLKLVSDEFDSQWNHKDDDLLVVPLSAASLSLIKTRATEIGDWQPGTKFSPNARLDSKWRHQNEATAAFIKAKRGILEMATGTGKTKTSLRIAQELFIAERINSVIVATDGNDLLDQWCSELLSWRTDSGLQFLLYKHYRNDHQGMTFCIRPGNSVLVVSRTQLGKFLAMIPDAQASKTLVIHDEVHGAGARETKASLAGKHARLGYVLGLSATPEREYDAEGTAFLDSEIGPIIFHFGLEDAIKRGILVEFDYIALPYELTDSDRVRLKAVYSQQAMRKREGHPMSPEELWMALSRVYKTAEIKPDIFGDFLSSSPEVLLGCIIFVEEISYGERILPLLQATGYRYRTYYADSDRENLMMFGRGEIDCIITCHRVSQGIDIRSLKTVVLMSSARARLETIQRIGRCLRCDPDNEDKRALVVDFVLETDGGSTPGSADEDRKDWLEHLSQIEKEVTHAN